MNIQLGERGINWTDATWNPITGCLHGCPYCYARAFARRYGRTFEPEFHPRRLDEPRHRRKQTKIFVGSNADNFGSWVPRDWNKAILEVVRDCPQHTFQFLTKAPENLVYYDWPENCWIGASATDQRMLDKALFYLSLVKASVKFVSAEPLSGPISADLSDIDWLIIGAQTGRNARQPKRQWTEGLLSAAREASVPVFLKDNLTWIPRYAEWPHELLCHSVCPPNRRRRAGGD